jgi:hypothetical protein
MFRASRSRCPSRPSDALHVGLQKFTPAGVRVQYSPNSEAFVIIFTFDNSPKMSVRIDARGIELPQRFHEVCPPLDEAIGMVLAREPFEQLVKDVVRRKVGSLGLEFGMTGVRYHYDTPTAPGADEVPETWGTLPSARTMGAIMKDRGFNPRFLLAAIESLGDPLQIIQTWVRSDVRNEEGEVVAPRAGDDDDSFYPIIINGQVPKRYAIIMPMR